MRITNKHNLPDILVRAARNDRYSRGNAHISATQLIDSPRVVAMKEHHKNEMEVDVSEMLWAMLGTALHKIIEDQAEHYHISEERLFMEVEGWTISGAVDLQQTDSGHVIIDWKSTSTWTVIFESFSSWEKQLNIYATLIEENKGVDVTGAKVIALLRDWQSSQVERQRDYPVAPIIEVPIPLWSKEKRHAYLNERVKMHQAASLDMKVDPDSLVRCTDEERWCKKDTWAVIKPGNKRATKVFDREADALEFLPEGHEVQHRKGEPVRCLGNYCGVSLWCAQFREYQDSLNGAEPPGA